MRWNCHRIACFLIIEMILSLATVLLDPSPSLAGVQRVTKPASLLECRLLLQRHCKEGVEDEGKVKGHTSFPGTWGKKRYETRRDSKHFLAFTWLGLVRLAALSTDSHSVRYKGCARCTFSALTKTQEFFIFKLSLLLETLDVQNHKRMYPGI